MPTQNVTTRHGLSAPTAPHLTSLMFALEPRYVFDGAMAETIGDASPDVTASPMEMLETGPSHRAMFTLVQSLLDGDVVPGAQATPAKFDTEMSSEVAACEVAPMQWVTFETLPQVVVIDPSGLAVCSAPVVEPVAVDAPPVDELIGVEPSRLEVCYAPMLETVAVDAPPLDEPMPLIGVEPSEVAVCYAPEVETIVVDAPSLDELMPLIAQEPSALAVCYAPPLETVAVQQPPADELMPHIVDTPNVAPVTTANNATVVSHHPVADHARAPVDLFKDWLKKFRSSLVH